MRVSYNKLWKMLIDKGMKKSQLREAVGASKSTFAKLGKNENVTLPVLLDICEYLQFRKNFRSKLSLYLLMKQINDTLVVGTIIVPRQECFVLEKDKRKRKKCQGKD